MIIKKDVFLVNIEQQGLSMTQASKKMEISRSYLWEVLQGKKNAGSKFMAGLKKVFPNEQLENFFII